MYTYLIGWRNLDRWYYGVRLNYKSAPAEDLWLKYKTSSKYVRAFVAEHGDPDVIRVHKIFGTAEEAYLYETKFLRRLKAHTNPRFLNQNICGKPQGGTDAQKMAARRPKSEEHKRKIGEANRGRKRPDWSKFLTELNKKQKGQAHPMFGRKHTSEAVELCREAARRSHK